jgi:hypothetical protein
VTQLSYYLRNQTSSPNHRFYEVSMMIKARFMSLLTILLILFSATVIRAQDPAAQPAASPADEEQQKAKDAAEKKAAALLEQVVSQLNLLKLPENRIRVQIAAGDLLWKRNEARARSLFSAAGDGVAEMMHSSDGNMQRWAAQLRQEVVLTAAQHDAPLAYQLLAVTKSQAPPSDNNANNFRRPNLDANLEQTLLARVAAIDPKLAAQKVEESLAKGEYPGSLAQVLSSLQSQDKDAATKLTSKVISKLQSENMLTNPQAQSLALSLLRPGPRPAQSGTDNAPATVNQAASTPSATNPVAPSQPQANNAAVPVLSESAFDDLMNTIIDAAMRATPQTAANNPRGGGGPNNPRGRGGNFNAAQNTDQSTPSDGQIEQQNARRLLGGLQGLLTQIDQYLPSRAATVRNKMTELGMGNSAAIAPNQFNALMRQGNSDSLLAAAPTAPPPMQPRIYQQAAQKALDEGNADRARQIANDHLDTTTRDAMLQKVDFQVMAAKVETENMDQLRQTLAGLRSDDERIDLLLQLSAGAQKTTTAHQSDPKLALKFLTEAQRLTNRHATSYKQFEQQLRVAAALEVLEPSRSFEVLDPGINQLNDLLSAAALLSGFEVNIFKDGELPIEGGSDLGDMVARFGQELATLATIDFERAEGSANKFQLPEARLMAQMTIVRNVLGVPQAQAASGGINGFGRGGFPGRRPQ